MTTMRERMRGVALYKQLGSGLITGAADDDHSGIATYSQAGAKFGFGPLWTIVLSYPLMTAIQLVSARIGRVTGKGLAHNLGRLLPAWLVTGLAALLFVANTINMGADLAAVGASAQLVAGFGSHLFAILFALVSLVLQLFIPYRRYAAILKWLTLVLLAYVALVFMVKIDWAQAAKGLVVPTVGPDSITTIVAILGTTISPYLFFWQSAQEVEEVAQDDDAEPLKRAPERARPEFKCIGIDTFGGMAVSNIVAIAIMLGTAATLHASGKTEIGSAADAAQALEPVAGKHSWCSVWGSSAPACLPSRFLEGPPPMPSVRLEAGNAASNSSRGRPAASMPSSPRQRLSG